MFVAWKERRFQRQDNMIPNPSVPEQSGCPEDPHDPEKAHERAIDALLESFSNAHEEAEAFFQESNVLLRGTQRTG